MTKMPAREIFRVFEYAAAVAGCKPEELTLTNESGRSMTLAQALEKFGYKSNGHKKPARVMSDREWHRQEMEKRLAKRKARCAT